VFIFHTNVGCIDSTSRNLPTSPQAKDKLSGGEHAENNLIASSEQVGDNLIVASSPTINVDDFSELFGKREVNLPIPVSDDDPSNLPSSKTSTPGTGSKLVTSRDSLLPPVSFQINPSAYGVSQAAFDELNFEGKRLGKVEYDVEAYHRLKAKGKITEMQLFEIMNAFQGHMYELTHPEKLSFWNPSSVSMESFNLSDYTSESATASEELPLHLDEFLSSNTGAKFRGFGGVDSNAIPWTPILRVMNDSQPGQDSTITNDSRHGEIVELRPLMTLHSGDKDF